MSEAVTLLLPPPARRSPSCTSPRRPAFPRRHAAQRMAVRRRRRVGGVRVRAPAAELAAGQRQLDAHAGLARATRTPNVYLIASAGLLLYS
jgi:hypothetical protein